MLYPVILCGGSGSRLWPLSRTLYPKQFMQYDESSPSLFAQTLTRIEHLKNSATQTVGVPIIICHEDHRFFVAANMQQTLKPNDARPKIILEPQARNTAPATTLVALAAITENPDANILILPSDHLLRPEDALLHAVNDASPAAQEGFLVTFGIKPEKPETGYGYIKVGATIDNISATNSTYHVEKFVEKPPLDLAKTMLDEGGYFWNSGMFLFRAQSFLDEIAKYAPNILQACKAAWEKREQDNDFIRPSAEILKSCPSESIDYAVMEYTKKAAILPLEVYWNDLGSWDSLYNSANPDANGNVCRGDVIAKNTNNSYIHSQERLITTIGLDDIIVVETADAVLVADKNRSQEVKDLVKIIEEQGREEVNLHQKVYRPWGNYESLVMAERFQVKRIEVNPSAALSLQRHYHRAEHWIVVSGTAEITLDDKVFFLAENESTYIPSMSKHRLKNPGMLPLVLIEIQSGSYLGEDDIERFDDEYGRG